MLRACTSLTSLDLRIGWEPEEELPGQISEDLLQLFGSMARIESLSLSIAAAVVGLEAFVSGVTSLTRLHTLSLGFTGGDAVAVLPACISVLGGLTALELHSTRRLACAPGWAALPKLESLRFNTLGLEGDADSALPGMSDLTSLSSLVFVDVDTLTRWPSALWRLSRLRTLGHGGVWDADDPPPRVAFAPAWSQLQGLQELDLRNQGYLSFPAVVTQLRALTRLNLEGCGYGALPAGFTALTSLVCLEVGDHDFGDLDVSALGCLAAFPRLTRLSLSSCAAAFSAGFADAAHHSVFRSLRFENAFAAAGPSRAAVLAYALQAREQGRRWALSLEVWSKSKGSATSGPAWRQAGCRARTFSSRTPITRRSQRATGRWPTMRSLTFSTRLMRTFIFCLHCILGMGAMVMGTRAMTRTQ